MKPTLFQPPSESRKPRPASQQSDYARTTAVNAKADATNVYNDANSVFSADITRYNAANDDWSHVGPNMSEPDHTNCLDALNSAYTQLQGESDCVTSSYEHLGAAQQLIVAGDEANSDGAKIQDYNDSTSSSGSAKTAAQNAAPKHTSFAGYATTAESILANYG